MRGQRPVHRTENLQVLPEVHEGQRLRAPCDSQLLDARRDMEKEASTSYRITRTVHHATRDTHRALACTGRKCSGCSSMHSPGRRGEHISSKSEQARRIRMECKTLRMKQLSQPSVDGSMRQSRRSAQKQGTGSIRLGRTRITFPRVCCSLPSSPARDAKDRP